MPQAIAAAVVSFFQLTGTAATIVAAAVEVAILAGVSAVVKQNSETKDEGGLINLELNPSAPRHLIVGKRMIGGNLVDWYVAAPQNTKLFLPIYLSEGPAGTVTRVLAGGRVVWSTPLVHGVRTTIPEFRSGGDRLWLTYYDGRVGQTADPSLVALNQGWTADNKMTGCAYVVAEMQWDSDNMRSPVQLIFEHEGAKLYDRRKDTTAGGSGSHRLNDPSTWELGDAEGANPAVALDHYQLGRYWNGQRVFGIGMAPSDVPYARFAAQANICDENVELKAGGTQKRYRANGVLSAADPYDETIKALCKAMAAEPADFGGRVGVVGVEARTPVLVIDDEDLIDGAGETFTPKRSWGELVGAVEGKYHDPTQLYQPVPYAEATDAAWSTQDGGEPKRITHDLEFETNGERAQRLAMLKAKYERRQATLNGVYPFWAIELERGDWFLRTGRAGSRFGETGKLFEVMDRILDPKTFLVAIPAKEVDATDSAWSKATAKDAPPAPTDGTYTLAPVQVPAITVTAISLVGTASSIPAMKVAFTTPTDPRIKWLYIEVENVDGVTPKVTKTVAIPADDNSVVFSDGIVDGDGYAVSAKYITTTLRSEWSVAAVVNSSGNYAVGTASAVPWSGVTSRPTNLSDLTGTEPIKNELVAMGANGVIDSGFRTPLLHWSLASLLNTPTVNYLSETQIRKARITGAASTPATATAQLGGALGNSVPCIAGDRIEASAYFGAAASGWGSGQLYVDWYTSAVTPVYISSSLVGSTTMTGALGNGDLSTFARVAGFATAPATAGLARIVMRFVNTSGGARTSPVGSVCLPLIRRADATQTAFSPWEPGLDAVPGADITANNTAGAIVNQGTLAVISRANVVALAGTEGINNALVPVGGNGLVDTAFRFQSTYWAKDSPSGTTTFSTIVSTGGLRASVVTGSGVTVNGADYVRQHSYAQRDNFPCKPGDVVGARVLVGGNNVSQFQLLIAFRDALGNAVGFSTATILSTGILAGTGEETTFNELANVATAPAGTVTANIDIRGIASTGAPVSRIAKPMLAILAAGQTVAPVYSPGREHEIGANVTETRTAANILNQGDLAVSNRSSLPFGANALTNTEFSISTSYPPLGYTSGGVGNLAGVAQAASIVTAGPRRAVKSVMTGTVSSGTYFDLFYGHYSDVPNARRYQLPVVAGDVVGASALVAKNAAVSTIYVNIQWLNEAGIYVSETAGTQITANANGDTGNPTDYALSSVVATAPANARFANLFVRCLPVASAVNATGWAMSPMLCRLQAGQAVVPVYTPGGVDRNADQTSSNTAASIANQGWAATQGEAATSNAQVALGENMLVNTDWQEGIDGWYQGWTGNTGLPVFQGMALAGWSGFVKTSYVTVSGTPAINTVADALCSKTYNELNDLRRYSPRIAVGDRLHVSTYAAGHRCRCALIVAFFDENGSVLTDPEVGRTTSDNTPGGFANGRLENAQRIGGFLTVPASTCYMMIIQRLIAVGGVADPYAFFGFPMVAKVSASQTTAPAYRTGAVDRYVDYTPENTAGGIINQGSGATANSLAALNSADGASLANTVSGLSTVTGNLNASYALAVDAGGRIASMKLLSNGAISSVKFKSDTFSIFNNVSDVAVFDVTGSQIKMIADLNVASGITVGSARLKVALESIRKTGVDGAAITWADGASIGNIPEYVLDLSNLSPLSSGEAYNVVLTGVTPVGATVYAKISTPGTTATVSKTGSVIGGGANPQRIMTKPALAGGPGGLEPADAYDYTYNFRVMADVTVLGYFDGEDTIFDGSFTISTWFNDGFGWDRGPDISENVYFTTPGNSSGYSIYELDNIFPVSWSQPVGATAPYAFGISAVSGCAVTNLDTISYVKQTASGTRTASPGGQSVKIVAFPRNA